MAHYYENDPTLDKTEFPVSFTLCGRSFTLNSSAGVFSKDGLDTGTRILLEWILQNAKPAKDVLDLGCGIGVIGAVLSSFWHCKVTGIDPNSQACHLAEENYTRCQVDGSVIEADHINDANYDMVVLNPPIRTGKAVIYSLFSQSYDHLLPGGVLYIVIRKQHGAQSTLDYLNSIGFKAGRVARDKGFWIIEARKPQDKAAE